MEASYSNTGGSGFLKFLAVIIVVILIVWAMPAVSTAISHAASKHGSDMTAIVHSCIDGGKQTLNYFSQSDGKYLRFCDIGDGRIGLQVLIKEGKEYKEITAYIKNGLSNIADVMKFAKNAKLPQLPRLP